MAADYADFDDLKTHWPAVPAERQAEAEQKLHEASVKVRASYPDVDRRIAAGVLDPDVPRLVVCGMAKRALDVPDVAGGLEGVASLQQATGPFSQTTTFRASDGSLFFSAEDKRLLRASRPIRQAWTIHPTGGAI